MMMMMMFDPMWSQERGAGGLTRVLHEEGEAAQLDEAGPGARYDPPQQHGALQPRIAPRHEAVSTRPLKQHLRSQMDTKPLNEL
jgi:hypothetical protein